MAHTDSSTPFDHEFEARSDMTEEFWGGSAEWQPAGDRPSRRLPRVDDTGSLRALRDGVAAFRPQRVELRDPTGEVRRTRSHGATRPETPTAVEQRADASIGDLAAGHFDDPDERPAPEHDVALSPAQPVTDRLGLGGVDPLLVRLGVLVLVGVLLVPLALALRSDGGDPDSIRIDAPDPSSVVAAGVNPGAETTGPDAIAEDAALPLDVGAETSGATSDDVAAGEGASAAESEAASTATAAPAPTAAAEQTESNGSADSDNSVGDVPQSVGSGIEEPAVVEIEAERIVPECPQTYEAGAGDSWYRIADAAGVTPSAILTENRATIDTVILPGDDICLPAGATKPSPPTTDAPETTQPATTQPATTAPTTTEVTSTVAATVPSGSPGRNASVDEVKALIRSMFPESEWETAFTIAQRESKFIPTAYNGWCCYGVFQIYWSVHKGWLGDLGINSSDDLLDPLLNIRAAHELWERSGNSWTPWSTYDG